MFSSHKKSAPEAPHGDAYDDEQHLVAAVSEFKKVESATQTMVDQLYQRLASPFQITAKPCEASRVAVLQCYQKLQGAQKAPVASNSSNNEASGPSVEVAKSSDKSINGSSADIVASSASAKNEETWLSTPYQQCYDIALEYNRCVEEETLSKHLAQVAAFEMRGAQQQIVHKASMET